jgi:two-component system, NtrC family, sensor histidine kinase PilS
MLTLIIGRLMVIFILLVTGWIWNSGRLQLSFEQFPQDLFLVFLIWVGLTIAYFFLLRLSKNYRFQIKLQFGLDALLITALVWRTGDLASPYIPLYIVLVGLSSIFLRPRSTLVMSVICVVLLLVLAILSSGGFIESSTATLPIDKIVQVVSFHMVAFLVVGLLASRLAGRHASGEELKETAKTLASLRLLHERIVESIRSGLITTDLEGTIYTFNLAASEITGLRPEEVRGSSVYSIFGDIREQIRLSLDAVEAGEAAPRFEASLQTPDGFAVRIGYGISQLFSQSHEPTGLIITFQDLTEIRSMEESVRRKDRLAAVGRVAAGLAHEIRNPLGAMRGAIQVLDSTTARGSAQAELMDIILKESDRLNRIITNFLNYARPGASEFTETDVAETIRETIKLIRHSPDVREGHTLIDQSGTKPVMISADAAQLKQIFWNLARNALQAMPDGGRLRFRLESIPNNRVRISIEDTGAGMSQDQVEQLFEPFSTSTTGGTGLGLSIVYQIVRDHNGTISVRSIEGAGTTIVIELPRDNRTPRRERLNGTAGESKLSELLRVETPTDDSA